MKYYAVRIETKDGKSLWSAPEGGISDVPMLDDRLSFVREDRGDWILAGYEDATIMTFQYSCERQLNR